MNKQTLGIGVIISAVLLAVGVFLPLIQLSVYGEVTYNEVAPTESYLVILFALLAPVFLFTGKTKLLLLSPVGAWLVLLFPMIQDAVKGKDESFIGKITEGATSKVSQVAGDLFMNITEFSWGGYVFLLALIALTVCCTLRFLKSK